MAKAEYIHSAVFFGDPTLTYQTGLRAYFLHPDEPEANRLLLEMWLPPTRLASNEAVIPYVDLSTRYLPEPGYVTDLTDEVGWQLEGFIERLFPSDPASELLKEPLLELLDHAARKYYKSYRQRHPDTEDKYRGVLQPHFAEISESSAYGSPFDKLARAMGQGLSILKHEPSMGKATDEHSQIGQRVSGLCQDYLVRNIEDRSADLDLVFISPDDSTQATFILDYWDSIRNSHLRHRQSANGQPDAEHVGKNYHMVEAGQDRGDTIYQGWLLDRYKTEDGIDVLCLRAGTFARTTNPSVVTENAFELLKQTFAIEMTALPASRRQLHPKTSRRMGDYVSYADDRLRLFLKSRSLNEMELVVTEPEWDWHLNIYGRNRYYLFGSVGLFGDRPRIIETMGRGVRQMAARVGLFYVDQLTARQAEYNIDDELWRYITPEEWVNYQVYNFLGATHFSPFVFAANLIPNSRLDALPEDLKLKLATHGIDHSLSLGNLWPETFLEMTDDQIATFLRAVPRQIDYIYDYLAQPTRLENQGIWKVMQALQKAGVDFPKFRDQTLLQGLYVFRHPQDYELASLGALDNLRQYLDRKSDVEQNTNVNGHDREYDVAVLVWHFIELIKTKYYRSKEFDPQIVESLEWLIIDSASKLGKNVDQNKYRSSQFIEALVRCKDLFSTTLIQDIRENFCLI